MKTIKHLLSQLLFLSLCFGGISATAAPRPESETVAQARELVDTYYGNRTNLTTAAALLEQAYQADPTDAHVFVQAARITVMGGHLSFGRFEAGTFERYAALLDKAIALDPSNPKAHILKAEVFFQYGKYDEELASLDRAQALGTPDPWLLIGYGRHYMELGDGPKSFEMYSQVERRGPGSTPSERKAYVSALGVLPKLLLRGEKRVDKLRKYAALALQARYPTDAWTPLGYAEGFLDRQLYDEAIFYAREALKTMDFGAGRMTLAASLYAKAADLRMKGQPLKDLKPFTDEARTFGFGKTAVVEYLVERRGIDGSFGPLKPMLEKIIR